ncbi:MAG TPA: sigma-70 family RNA polymerase sigma factor [Candidatus Angelobacter sp.]|jgi:RNA polymerase sigma-70 factor (ECF subfamily)
MSSESRVFDAAYLDALRQGDPATEAHFVNHFNPILMRKLRRGLRSREHTEDLCQETFLRVLTAVRSGRGIRKPERFEIYVLGVCGHVLHERWRELRRAAALQPLDIDLPGDFPSAYALVLEEETKRSVRRVLARLEEDQQDVLQAVLMDDQNKDEICRRYGISRNYLRLLLYRAKKEFRNRAGKSLPAATRRLPNRRMPRRERSQCATPAAKTGLLARSVSSALKRAACA